MKIEKTCSPVLAAGPLYRTLSQIPSGTVFRFNVLTAGPYLRVNTGVVDLQTNIVYADGGSHGLSTLITQLVILDKARLVTGEE